MPKEPSPPGSRRVHRPRRTSPAALRLGPREERWLAGLVIAGCVALAVSNAFVLDDAFISFRYARNLVETGELTWNPGEAVPVEGYTNFLWTLLLAAGLALGVEPVIASQVLGLAAFLATLLVAYRLAVEVLGSPGRGIIAVGLLGTNYTFSCFATGGLETQLQALLITTCAWTARQIAHGAPGAGRYAILSLLTAAAVMTRLDSALPCAMFFGWAWIASLRKRPPPWAIVARAIASAVPALLVLGPWLLWKLAYYGDILPNTYYLKVLPISLAIIGQGLGYGLNFIYSYQLLPSVVLALARFKSLLRHQELSAFSLVVLAWCAYVVRVGGGFMEFRMIVPVMPLAFLIITFVTIELPARPRALLIALVVFGSGFHAWNFNVAAELETISSLRRHIENESENWPRIGEVLGELFAEAEDPVMIATGAAGAIPYYSRLPTIDSAGLSDLWVAHHTPVLGIRPGHSKRAGFEYLVRRRVQLVFEHPWIRRLTGPAESETTFPARRLPDFAIVDLARLPADVRLLEIPVDDSHGFKVLYLVPNPSVDEVIEQRGLRTWTLDRN